MLESAKIISTCLCASFVAEEGRNGNAARREGLGIFRCNGRGGQEKEVTNSSKESVEFGRAGRVQCYISSFICICLPLSARTGKACRKPTSSFAL